MDYPETRVVRHRDLSPNVNGNGEVKPMEWTKACPYFEVKGKRWEKHRKEEVVSKLWHNLFYAQSPDFRKPGLCYYPKFLYL